MHAPECPQCRVTMEEGFLVDRGHGDSTSVGEWAEGQPVRRWWGLNMKGKERIPVVAYRCAKCGLLRSYAVEA